MDRDAEQRNRDSLAAMRERLAALQQPLGDLMLRAELYIEEFHLLAPRPVDAPKNFPVTSITTINIEPSREISTRLTGNRTLVIDRNPASAIGFPLCRAVLWVPHTGETKKKISVSDLSNQSHRQDLPYDIETSVFSNNGQHLEFLGYGYENQEPFVEEITLAVDEAFVTATSVLRGEVARE